MAGGSIGLEEQPRNDHNTDGESELELESAAKTTDQKNRNNANDNNYNNNNDNNNVSNNNHNQHTNWLVVGDGDLSYSASIAGDLARNNIRLFATVLEEEEVHDSVYQRSAQNKAAILSHPIVDDGVAATHQQHDANDTANDTANDAANAIASDDDENKNDENENENDQTQSDSRDPLPFSQQQHRVLFGIDATQLAHHFSDTKFQTIEFNFPHWRGKTNAKRNRQLLDDFLGSASEVLDNRAAAAAASTTTTATSTSTTTNGSKIIVSLCEGQGGFPASTAEEWKQSWLVPKYAAEHGLLLRDLQPYEPAYQQTSHRGKDRPWVKDGTDQRYVFGFPNNESIHPDLQISCRHELRIVLPRDFGTVGSSLSSSSSSSAVSRRDILEGDAVYELTRNFVPDGIRMEVAAREILEPYVMNGDATVNATANATANANATGTLAIFLLNYSGEKMPLTRQAADAIRSGVEASVREDWGFVVAKAGRLVSLPYPTHLLPSLVRESTERVARLTNPAAGSNNNPETTKTL